MAFLQQICLHVHVASEVENWNTILWCSAVLFGNFSSS